MYGKIILGVGISASIHAPRLLCFKEDMEDYDGIDSEFYEGDIDLINDLYGDYATPSNASASNATLLTDVQPDTFEWAVIDRLNVISISAILATCFLFLILIRRR